MMVPRALTVLKAKIRFRSDWRRASKAARSIVVSPTPPTRPDHRTVPPSTGVRRATR